MASFAVIGLGMFGKTVALELVKAGQEVIGIDSDEDAVADVARELTQAVTADATDERVLDELGIAQCDGVLVAIGGDIEASMLTTLLLTEKRVPQVWVKARDWNHHRILSRLSVQRIIHPEYEVGLRVAQQFMHRNLEDMLEFGSGNYVIETGAPEHTWGMRVDEVRDVRVLAHRRADVLISEVAGENGKIQRGDSLLILGPRSLLDTFDRAF